MAKKKKESEARYRIELTEKQMRVLMKYVEITMRLFMGQSWDFCDEIASLNYMCKFPLHVGGEPFPKIEKIEG